jgi:hypothetical protein
MQVNQENKNIAAGLAVLDCDVKSENKIFDDDVNSFSYDELSCDYYK